MNVLLAGGDRLDLLMKYLKDYGFDDCRHCSGRRKKDGLKKNAKDPDLCILFTNFASHNFAEQVKRDCKQKNIPLICSERKWCHLQKKLEQQGFKPVAA